MHHGRRRPSALSPTPTMYSNKEIRTAHRRLFVLIVVQLENIELLPPYPSPRAMIPLEHVHQGHSTIGKLYNNTSMHHVESRSARSLYTIRTYVQQIRSSLAECTLTKSQTDASRACSILPYYERYCPAASLLNDPAQPCWHLSKHTYIDIIMCTNTERRRRTFPVNQLISRSTIYMFGTVLACQTIEVMFNVGRAACREHFMACAV